MPCLLAYLSISLMPYLLAVPTSQQVIQHQTYLHNSLPSLGTGGVVKPRRAVSPIHVLSGSTALPLTSIWMLWLMSWVGPDWHAVTMADMRKLVEDGAGCKLHYHHHPITQPYLESEDLPCPACTGLCVHAGHNMGAMHSGRGTNNYGKLGLSTVHAPSSSSIP